MTVIAAIVDPSGAYMAADSRVCRGTEYMDGVIKIRKAGLSLIGNSGYAHFDTVIDRVWAGPGPGDTAAAIEAKCRVLAAELRSHRERTTIAGEESPWCSCLIATLHGLWRVDSGGDVIRVERGWDAAGSGGSEARAVLWLRETYDSEVLQNAGTALHVACQAAIALDNSCGGIVRLLSVHDGAEVAA